MPKKLSLKIQDINLLTLAKYDFDLPPRAAQAWQRLSDAAKAASPPPSARHSRRSSANCAGNQIVTCAHPQSVCCGRSSRKEVQSAIEVICHLRIRTNRCHYAESGASEAVMQSTTNVNAACNHTQHLLHCFALL